MTTSDRQPRPTRRQLFSRAAAALGTGVAVQATGGLDKAAAAAKVGGPWGHAVGDPRGSDIVITTGRSAEARFGLMFKKLPAYAPPDNLLTDLASTMTDPRVPGTDPSTSDQYDNFELQLEWRISPGGNVSTSSSSASGGLLSRPCVP